MLSQCVPNPRLACVAALLVCLAGCGRPTADVAGTITIAGKAPNLPGLEIAFLADDGAIATAPINLDGTYVAKKVPVGELRIGFTGGYPKGAAKGRRPIKDPDGQIAPLDDGLSNFPIPPLLRAPTTSELKLTVQAGQANIFNHDIRP